MTDTNETVVALAQRVLGEQWHGEDDVRLAEAVLTQHKMFTMLLREYSAVIAEQDRDQSLLTQMVRECMQLREGLREALDWATAPDHRHNLKGGYSSELLPMYTCIGDNHREQRLATLRVLLKDL